MHAIKMIKPVSMGLLLISIVFSGFVFAGEGPVKQKSSISKGALKLQRELNLNEEQLQEVNKIYQEERLAREKERSKYENANKYADYLSLPADTKEYEMGYKKEAEIAAEKARNRVITIAEGRRKIYMLLNDEQKKRFLELNKRKPRKMNNTAGKQKKPGMKSEPKAKKAAKE